MKQIYLLMEDYYHKRDVILPGLEAALAGSPQASFVASDDPADIPWNRLSEECSIFISQKGEDQKIDNEEICHWISDERAENIKAFVEAGGAALLVHCGTVLASGSPVYKALVGGSFLQHPPQTVVTYTPINAAGAQAIHPIVKGIESFSAMDEHYHCEVYVPDNADAEITPLLYARSKDNAATLAGWCKTVGQGRIVVLTPGHSLEVVQNPQFTALLRNSVKWLLKETSE